MRLPWRRIVGNGVLFGVIFWLHLLLLAVVMSMRARLPDADAPWTRGDASMMQVRWIEVASVARSSSSRRSAGRPSVNRTQRRSPEYRAERLAPRSALADPAALSASASEAPASAPVGAVLAVPAAQEKRGDAFGDPSIRDALRTRSSGAVPALPGGSDTPLSHALRVVPPASLGERVKSIGNYMNCSIVEMARNRPGQLNVVRIGDAYSALGCKK